jgi:hypothetical protein
LYRCRLFLLPVSALSASLATALTASMSAMTVHTVTLVSVEVLSQRRLLVEVLITQLCQAQFHLKGKKMKTIIKCRLCIAKN